MSYGLSDTRYFTGVPCQRGHVDERVRGSRACIECMREIQAKYRDRHRETLLERWAQERFRTREACRQYAANRYVTDKDAIRAASAAWDKRNPDKVAAKTARRKAAKLQATPVWADVAAIQNIYAQAQTVSRLTGVPHQVDHIIPLRGVDVCGLHVETNLRVVTASENARKRNKDVWRAMTDTALK